MNPLLIAYDGSASADAALEFAGRLFGGRDAVVVTVFEPLLAPDGEAPEAAAGRVCERGAARATELGVKAVPRPVSEPGAVWAAIDRVAEEIRAALIVTGSRGLDGSRALVTGSVADYLLHHATTPVLVVPDLDLATARKDHRMS
ncbi:nucleotide-binding universal stress UspA family protein [Actinocorallia herbida]|uniref:Nucleotide-binding universal stress UspA family protein n=1 Tax=Actinocorallia herbida TaxID=58109 RepID=A0A3N1CV81_9ACTN|nr:universal stress protein [Actinocorallia herbida]ROO85203.1 nucleotide-binding universal stress UspA family protein [Actinocorallia herbida]